MLLRSRRPPRNASLSAPADTDPVAEEESVADDLADLLRAHDEDFSQYARTLGATLGRGVAALALVSLFALTQLNPDAPRLVLPRFDGGDALAAFGVVGLFVTTLQLAVRDPGALQQPTASAGRQQLLTLIAALLVPTSLGLGIYIAIPYMIESAPTGIDLVRGFGPIAIGILLALFAADAAAAVPLPPTDPAVRRTRRKIAAEEQRAALSALKLRAGPSSVRGVIGDIARIVGLVVAQLLVLNAVTPADIEVVVARAAALTAFAVFVTAAVYDTFVAAARRRWSPLTPAFLPFILAVVGVSGTIVIASIESADGTNPVRAAADALLRFAVVTCSNAGMAFYLTGRRRRPRSDDGPAESRLLRAIAIKLAESKANRLHDGVLRDESRRPATLPLNRLAVISPFVSVVFPLGLILAAAAREQIATVSPPEERGEGWARAAEVISWTVASLVLIVPAVALAISTATTT
ncbi:hypothetical protein [Microbacterium plantarum]|uniref:hypothetical protein n=1 Tax=Microbacterium plantarum TaxID=1816425 RepID=UPI002B45DB18|nr:hypothetical protein [Microbacterium plantarum]WRK16932.1 hypothetical protein VC184_13625 [Microbacterium plantarum]